MVKIYMEEEQKLLIFHKKHNFFLYFALKNTIFWVKFNKINTTNKYFDKNCVKRVDFFIFFAKQNKAKFQWRKAQFFNGEI